MRNIFALSPDSTLIVQDVCYLSAIALLQLLSIQPIGIHHILILIRIAGIVIESQIPSPFGFSVLLQFAVLNQIERYIEEAYNVANLAYLPYFQIQSVSVNVDDSDLSAIQPCQANFLVLKEKKGYKKLCRCIKKVNKTRTNKKRKGEGRNEDNTIEKCQFLSRK